MKRFHGIRELKPLKIFTHQDREEALKHLSEKTWLYEPGKTRYICSLLGALYEELKRRPDLQDLVLECTWMVNRMQKTGKPQDQMWEEETTSEGTRHPSDAAAPSPPPSSAPQTPAP